MPAQSILLVTLAIYFWPIIAAFCCLPRLKHRAALDSIICATLFLALFVFPEVQKPELRQLVQAVQFLCYLLALFGWFRAARAQGFRVFDLALGVPPIVIIVAFSIAT